MLKSIDLYIPSIILIEEYQRHIDSKLLWSVFGGNQKNYMAPLKGFLLFLPQGHLMLRWHPEP